jgi:hypothetical protein
MKQEDKKLLLKELCTRLPYGVKVYAKYIDTDTDFVEVEKVGVLSMVDKDAVIAFTCDDTDFYNYVEVHEVKPYLFPLSSMTEEQMEEYNDLNCYELGCFPHLQEALDYLIENHFDYRYLIDRGLAIDATNLNIY